uniref:Uncharacterized protein n=1 Tax=Anguilla anguilla TaxID=7936 RepID=A0A0E9R6D5_ANGAN
MQLFKCAARVMPCARIQDLGKRHMPQKNYTAQSADIPGHNWKCKSRLLSFTNNGKSD